MVHIKTMSRLLQQQIVSTQFERVKSQSSKIHPKILQANMEILGRNREGKFLDQWPHPWQGLNIDVLQWAQLGKENNFELNWVGFELILTYSLQIEYMFNRFLAKQSIELT